jgi:four helix bundle protein
MRDDKPNLIVELSFQFAVDVTLFCEDLDKLKKFRLSNQLFGSGTSIGANVREAQNPESKRDFIHKMKIAAKEADETQYWLLLCEASSALPTNLDLLKRIHDIIRILSKIISASKIDANN